MSKALLCDVCRKAEHEWEAFTLTHRAHESHFCSWLCLFRRHIVAIDKDSAQRLVDEHTGVPYAATNDMREHL
jgi:hypothetical protein